MAPPPHPFERRELDLFDGLPRVLLTDQFGLVKVVGRLGD